MLAETLSSAQSAPRQALLLIEPAPLVRRALARYLGRFFDEVWTATTAAEVEAALGRGPTHIVCSSRSGGSVGSWRARQATVRRVVVLSGRAGVRAHAGVDNVVQEPCNPQELLDCLLLPTWRAGHQQQEGVTP